MSNFAEAIKTAILLFPFVALLFTVPYILYEYHKYGSVNSWRTVIIYSFILYMISAYFLIILPLPSMEYVLTIKKPAYNLQPFLFVKKILTNTGLNLSDFKTYFPTLKNAVVYEAIFNTFLTIPFGVYLHYYFKCSFKKTLLLSFCLTLFFELTQLSGLYFIYPRSYRVFDVDDLILNTFGGVIGYFIGSLFLKFLPSRDEIDKESYLKGESISFLRRVAAFGLDMFAIFILTFFWGFIIYTTSITKYYLLIPLIIYYILAIIFKRTVGMSFLNLKYESFIKDNIKWWNVLGYHFFFFSEYVILPFVFIILAYTLHKIGYLDQVVWEYTAIIIFSFTLMIYIISFLKRLFHMRLTYEYLSKLEMKSTIKYKEVTNE